jgi:hypothetical protein
MSQKSASQIIYFFRIIIHYVGQLSISTTGSEIGSLGCTSVWRRFNVRDSLTYGASSACGGLPAIVPSFLESTGGNLLRGPLVGWRCCLDFCRAVVAVRSVVL